MNELAVSVAVILFPGLIATIVCDKIAVHSAKWRSFKYAVYSFVFGVVSYAVLQIVFWLGQAAYEWAWCTPVEFTPLSVWSLATSPSQHPTINLWEVLFASLLAPGVAACATAAHTWKLLTNLAQCLKLSDKYGDENLFSYFLNLGTTDWVYVRDPTAKLTHRGRVWSYSETDHIQEIVLWDVDVYDYETSEHLYSLPAQYIARPAGTFSIEVAIPINQESVDDAKTNSPNNDPSAAS